MIAQRLCWLNTTTVAMDSIACSAMDISGRSCCLSCNGSNRFLPTPHMLTKTLLEGGNEEQVQIVGWYSTWSALGFVLCLMAVLGYQQRNNSRENNGNAKGLHLPPGSSGLPWIGETLDFIADGKKFVQSRRCRYGNIFRTHLLGCATVIVVGSANVRRVLLADEITVAHTSPGNFKRLLDGPGALSTVPSPGDHRLLRNAVARALTSRDFLSTACIVIQRVIRTEMSNWAEKRNSATSDDGNEGTPNKLVIGCVSRCRRMMFDIACITFLGVDQNSPESSTESRSKSSSVVQAFDEFSEAVFAFPFNFPGFALNRGIKARDKLLKVIEEKAELFRNVDQCSTQASNLSLLSLIMDNINDMIDSRDSTSTDGKTSNSLEAAKLVGNLLLELMFGAQETTISAMCAAIMMLSDRSDVIRQIHDEVTSTAGSRDESDGFLNYDTFRSLNFVNDVVSETLRLRPPIAGGFRKSTAALKIGEYDIPAGWLIMYSITDTHSVSTLFDNPTAWDPHRWQRRRFSERPSSPVSSATEKIRCHANDVKTPPRSSSRFEYIPFGGGSKRSCVGQIFARLVLAIFVLEISRIAPNGWDLVDGMPVMKSAPVPLPTNGLPIIVRRS